MDYAAQRERTRKQLMLCFQALDDKKAEDVRLLNVEGKSSVTDFILIATGTSEPHLKAIRDSLVKTLNANGIGTIGSDTETGSGWVVVDAFDFMVHILTAEKREYYRIESLWKDADEVAIPELASA